MPVDVDGLDDVFEDLDDLEDDFSGPTEDWVIGTAVEYSIYLEFGTRNMDPKPFFRPVLVEVRTRGVADFIEHNSKLEVEAIGSIRQLVGSLAFTIERRIKEVITEKGLIDTGTLRASILALPLGDASELPTVDEFSGFDSESPAPPDAGRALVSTDIEVPV